MSTFAGNVGFKTKDSFKTDNKYAHCLLALLDALEWHGDIGRILESMPCSPDKLTIIDFLNTMANLEFIGSELELRQDQIDESLFPGLFVDETGSVKVLLKSEDDNILAYDSDVPTYIHLKKTSTQGTFYIFKRVSDEGPSLFESQPDWFVKVLARFNKLFVNALLLSLLLSVLALLLPLFIMSIYGRMNVAGSSSTFAFWFIGVVVYIIANAGFRILRSYLMNFISVRIGNIVGNQIMRRLLYLSPSYTETASLGPQLARIRDFETVRDFFAGRAITALLDVPFILLLIVGLVIIGGSVAYVPLASILLFVVFGFGIFQVTGRVDVKASRAGTQKQEFLLEMISNLAAIKSTGSHKLWLERYRALSSESAVSAYNSAKVNAVINTITQVLVSGSIIATVAVGTMNVVNGYMSMGALMACIFLVNRILAPFRSGFVVLSQTGKIRKSITQLNRFMSLPQERKPKSTGMRRKSIPGRISFDQVSFRYSSDAFPALLGVSFDIKPGENLAIIGHEGAGSSTILKLILGMYVPQVGHVLVDGTNVRQMAPIMLRRSIAYASEAGTLFHGTIAENLRHANPTASEKEMHQATEKTRILSTIISMPDKFETTVELGSGKFSTNFIKRLSLAQALLKDSNLLLLDLPENGLSSVKWLKEELKNLKDFGTIIMATQNMDLLNLADKILWMDKGRIRMFGPSQEVKKKYIQYITQ